MKKYFSFVLFTLAALLFTACSSEEDVTAGNAAGTKGQLTFVFKGIKGGATTYAAGDVPATQLEKKVKDIAIYLFEKESAAGLADGELKYTKSFSSLTNTSGSATLNVGPTGLTGQYVVYFVANNGASQFIDMTNATVDGITEATFRNKATKAVANDIDKNLFLMTGQITTAIEATGTHAVTLTRRVARFDLVNNNFSNLTITKLTVQDATDKANAFGNAPTAVTTLPVTPSAITSFTWADVEANSVKICESNESLFYLNPTTTAATKIYIEGVNKKNSQPFIYELKVPTAIPIKANTRYKLTISNELYFTIAVADWDTDGDEIIDFKPGSGALRLVSAPVVTGGAYDEAESKILVTAATAATIDLSLTASSALGVDVTIVPETGAGLENWDDTKITVASNTTAGASTYSAPYFKSDVSLSVAAIAADKNFTSTVRITDKSSGEIHELTVYYQGSVYYPGTSLKPVVVGGITWAPVNVGATTVDATVMDLASMGYVYQWGRTSYPSVTKAGSVLTGDELKGPVSYANGTTGTHKDKFILTGWVIIDASFTQVMADALWSGANDQGPCPYGWRLPTKDELTVLSNKHNASKKFAVNRISITGDVATETLYLPAAGAREGADGKSFLQGSIGSYWSSSVSGAGAFSLTFFSTSSEVGSVYRSMGYSVRCVQK